MSSDDAARQGGGLAAAALSSAAAVPLAAALVSSRARRLDIRLLVIKGVVAELHGIRAPRIYADVDVLVESSRFADLLTELASAGWHERGPVWVYKKISVHSLTLIHDDWPCDIDVHVRFPGFLADDDVVFEELWRRRTELSIAGVDVVAADEVGSSAILGLHSLRKPDNPRNISELAYLSDRLRGRVEVIDSLARVAAATGSTQTLGPLLESLAAPRVSGLPVSPKRLRAWRWRGTGSSRAGQWLTYLEDVPWYLWPKELALVIWPPRDLYMQEHPSMPDSTWALFRDRARRIVTGAGDVLRMITGRGQRR
ncbi:hypothetical protein SCB71_15810 [Herbiconiux sp. KACC 21604]|uniref:hypothetical protein n=1 Tax=unclassified Herbiconiux TaxID=2618217 RepID=UPI001491E883|nr:hypothetical protein [Herbiconiux sp. SALV-R1]QJU54585.1 hypothetical protein HL652_13755 [Herbiconiux sp. SALV-R1]WPO85671.1 hypothetical protein SCB71_15810 [Herbiconiux sp. KACC 21604]